MAPVSEFVTMSVFALESCIIPGRKVAGLLKNIPMYEFFLMEQDL